MALCRVADIPGATADQYYLGAWFLGAAAAVLATLACRRMTPDWSWRRRALAGLGMGLMSVPGWRVAVLTMPDILRTFCAQGNLDLVIPPGQTLPPSLGYQLSTQVIQTTVAPLGYVILGALCLVAARQPAWVRRPTVAGAAAALTRLVPMGRGETRSMATGLAWFPLLALANVVLLLLTASPSVRTGDDSAVFSRIPLLHVVLLALAAGVAEEVVYRGVMQQGLKGLLRWARVPPPLAVGSAVAIQMVLFAYAHVGYANVQHLLFALLFGLVAGVVVEVWGLWCAIVLHALVDAASFLLSRGDGAAWAALVALSAAVLAFAIPEWLRVARNLRGRRDARG